MITTEDFISTKLIFESRGGYNIHNFQFSCYYFKKVFFISHIQLFFDYVSSDKIQDFQ